MERNVKGQISELENIIQSIVAKFDVVAHNNTYKKPSMYNLWLIHDIKTKKSNSTEMLKILSENNFCKESDIEQLNDELTRMQKVRLSVLPKNCIDSVMQDLKQIISNYDCEFVLNECIE
jgi:hypothetical protein